MPPSDHHMMHSHAYGGHQPPLDVYGGSMGGSMGGGMSMGGSMSMGGWPPAPPSELVPFSGGGMVQPTMSRPWAENIYDDMSLLSALGPPFSGFSIKRCQGFVRCDMDIDAEVVGWVIGKNGTTIKDLKNKTGCNMWVDQRALKLTITGPDARTVEHAAKSVEAYVAAAPIKAGAVEAAVARSLDCPPHLLDILGDRATIARIVKETRAQVVVNKKMARAIVRGGPHAVQLACAKVQAIIVAAAAEHQYNTELEAERRALAAERAANSEGGGSDRDSSGSYTSRGNSAVGSPAGSNPASPRSASGPTWSLFSGPSAFAAGSAALNGNSPLRPGQRMSSSAPGSVSSPALGGGAGSSPRAFEVVDGSLTTVREGVPASSLSSRTSGKSSPGTKPRSSSSSAMASRGSSRTSSRHASPSSPVAQGITLIPAPTSIEDLLAQLKLGKYQSAFEENEVDLEALPLMSEADLSELGIPKGPRLKILNAVKGTPGMATSSNTPTAGSASTSTTAVASAQATSAPSTAAGSPDRQQTQSPAAASTASA